MQRGRHFEPWAFAVGALVVKLTVFLVVRDNPFIESPSLDEVQHLREARAILATGWIRPEAFYFAPLYPYTLASLFAVVGERVELVRLVQVVLGCLNVAVIYALTREATGSRSWARNAAILTIFYGAFSFYENLLLKTTLAIFLQNLVLWTLVRAISGTRARPWAFAGLFLGILALVRGNTLVWIPFLVAGILWDHVRNRRPARLRRSLAFCALGLTVGLLPATVHNLAVSGDFVLTTYQGGSNTYIGNHEGATGGYVALRYGREEPWEEREDAVTIAQEARGRELSPNEVSRYWLGHALEFVLEHPADWLRLTVKKLWLTVSHHEGQDTISYPAFRTLEPIFLALPIRFGWIFALATVGFVVMWRGRRVSPALYLWCLGGVLSVALFFVVDRYRMPLVGLFTIFAAAGLGWIFEGLRQRRTLATASKLALACGAFLVSYHAPVSRSTAATWNNLAMKYVEREDWPHALRYFERALAGRPDQVKVLRNYAAALQQSGDACAAALQLGKLEHLLGQQDAGANLSQYLDRLQLAERRLNALEACAESQVVASESTDARARLEHILLTLLEGDQSGRWRIQDRLQAATFKARLGRTEEAIAELESTLERTPERVDAYVLLGEYALDLDRPSAALAAWRHALTLDPARTDLRRWADALEAEMERRTAESP